MIIVRSREHCKFEQNHSTKDPLLQKECNFTENQVNIYKFNLSFINWFYFASCIDRYRPDRFTETVKNFPEGLSWKRKFLICNSFITESELREYFLVLVTLINICSSFVECYTHSFPLLAPFPKNVKWNVLMRVVMH